MSLFEALESRRYMASNITYSPLNIYGTQAADVIMLSQSSNTLTVVLNGVAKNYSTYHQVPGSTPGSVVATYAISKVVIQGYGGNDTIKGDSTVQEPMDVYGGTGNDSVRGGSKNDKLYGGTGAAGESGGYDTLDGADGNDTLVAPFYSGTTMYGGAGNDTLTGGQFIDAAYGQDGDDLIDGAGSGDYLNGGNGHDVINGGPGGNNIVGGDGDDQLTGGLDRDTVSGGYGNDSILGHGSPDDLDGGWGDDTLDGGYGGSDDINGGYGWDTIDFSMRSAALKVSLDDVANDGETNENDNIHSDVETVLGGSGADRITGSSNKNAIHGNGGADTVRGGDGNDSVFGGWGDDVIYGEAGDDYLDGQYSEDRLYDGAGNDYLFGGTSDDTLVSVGGGLYDTLDGGAGDDQLWADYGSTEVVHSEAAENDVKAVHRVGSYANGAGKEPSGQNIADPGLYEPDVNEYSMYQTDLDDNPLFSASGPDEDDVNQGGLGDCWFLATLGAVALQNKERMRSHVVELGDGTYAAMFYEDGIRKFYRVDNDLPVRIGSSGLAYAGGGAQGSLWVAVLEKAYALHRGGDYDDLDGGWSEDAFEDLGIDNAQFDVDDDNIAVAIKDYLDLGLAVTVNTIWTLSGFDVGENWVASHAYTVVDIDLEEGTITVRNPWGSDAGTQSGSWVQGDNDGYVTYTLDSFINVTVDYTVGFM